MLGKHADLLSFLSFFLFSNFEASEMLILKLSVKLDFGEGASFVI